MKSIEINTKHLARCLRQLKRWDAPLSNGSWVGMFDIEDEFTSSDIRDHCVYIMSFRKYLGLLR